MAVNQSESDIRKTIKEYLQWTGWLVLWNLQGLGCYPGMSDMTAIKGGRVLWIEVKTFKGRQSEVQKQFQADVETHGGEYVVVRSIEDVKRAISKVG